MIVTVDQVERDAVVREALSWKGTPYRHRGKIKGVAADCGYFLLQVYRAAGLIPETDPGWYPPDWHLHRGQERYLEILLLFAKPSNELLPGNVVMHRFGRAQAHGAIIVSWPTVVHADIGCGVTVDSAEDPWLASRRTGIYTHMNWEME